jgi:hypothetical protein
MTASCTRFERVSQRLSERRAEAVRDYLITEHAIDPNRLIAKGYGKSQLLLPTEPTNALNRRVQFPKPELHHDISVDPDVRLGKHLHTSARRRGRRPLRSSVLESLCRLPSLMSY